MAEDFPSWAPCHYVHNNPIALVDPSGMSVTKYEDEDKNLLLETNDGSDAVVTVTNDKRAGFDAAVKGTKNTDDIAWNNSMKEYALGFELSDKQESLLSSMNSDWSRRTAIDYWKTGNFRAGAGFAFKEALSQWTNPELVVTGLVAGVVGYSAFAAKTATNLIPGGKFANHLFKGAGKLVDNPANRTLIQKIANGKPLGVDAYGKSWSMGVDGTGKSVYTYTQNGVVKGAGYATMTPAEMIAKYGLK